MLNLVKYTSKFELVNCQNAYLNTAIAPIYKIFT